MCDTRLKCCVVRCCADAPVSSRLSSAAEVAASLLLTLPLLLLLLLLLLLPELLCPDAVCGSRGRNTTPFVHSVVDSMQVSESPP
jgi:hypothetical protein